MNFRSWFLMIILIVLGLYLAYTSYMINIHLESSSVSGAVAKELRMYNQILMVTGVVFVVATLGFGTCHLKCDCSKAAEHSMRWYVGIMAILSSLLLFVTGRIFTLSSGDVKVAITPAYYGSIASLGLVGVYVVLHLVEKYRVDRINRRAEDARKAKRQADWKSMMREQKAAQQIQLKSKDDVARRVGERAEAERKKREGLEKQLASERSRKSCLPNEVYEVQEGRCISKSSPASRIPPMRLREKENGGKERASRRRQCPPGMFPDTENPGHCIQFRVPMEELY